MEYLSSFHSSIILGAEVCILPAWIYTIRPEKVKAASTFLFAETHLV